MKRKILCLPALFLIAIFVHAQTQPTHTVILILENHSYSEIAGNPNAPYINSVLSDDHTARFTQSYGLTHPSQPNYIMFFSGSSQGVFDNTLPSALPFTSSNLGASLIQSGFSFAGYSEDLPSVGYTGEVSGAYARKHNPWVNWQGASTNGIPSTDNRPFSDFPTDFNLLPTVSIVVPNLNHDIHDGTVAQGDAWVQNNLGAYIQWCKTHNSLFIFTFDEDDNSASNQILSFFTGANVRAGSYSQRITHYSILRTVEDLYQLPRAGASADSSAIQGIWLNALPVKFAGFTVTSQLTTSLLKWQTSEEYRTKEFIAERSIDKGQSWESLAVIAAAGNSSVVRNYSYTDLHPAKGINLYRIRQVDLNGIYTYSKIVAIEAGELNVHYKTYPNPAGNLLYITSTKNENNQLNVSVIDASGKKVLQKTSVLKAGIPAHIDVSHLLNGIYFIELNDGAGKLTQPLIINH